MKERKKERNKEKNERKKERQIEKKIQTSNVGQPERKSEGRKENGHHHCPYDR